MGQSGRVVGRSEPRFDIDLEYGRQGELRVGDFLEWIANGNGRVEVKRKRIIDWYFYVETECDKGRRGFYEPSGISVSRAESWAINFGDTGIVLLCPTEIIRFMLDEPTTKDKREDDGNCPTKGKLIDLVAMLFRYKQSMDRQGKTRKIAS